MDDRAFKDHIDTLIASVNGREIAADLGLRGDWTGKRFFCPSCQADGAVHKTPDLVVGEKGFKCWKCSVKGGILDLIQLAGRKTKNEAIEYLERRTGLVRPKGPGRNISRAAVARPGPSLAVRKAIPDEAPKDSGLYSAFLDKVCCPLAGTPGARYLEGRGISAAVAGRYGVRFCPDPSGLWDLADKAVIKAAGLSSLYIFQKAGLPVLVIPYIRQGKPVFLKTRCLLSKAEADRRGIARFLNTAGKVPCLWNHDAVAAANKVIITEGEIDALSAIMLDLVGIGLPGWAHWKDAWTPDFAGKDVVLVLDADAPGAKGTADIAKRFMRAGLPCPLEWKLRKGTDLNDYLMERRKS